MYSVNPCEVVRFGWGIKAVSFVKPVLTRGVFAGTILVVGIGLAHSAPRPHQARTPSPLITIVSSTMLVDQEMNRPQVAWRTRLPAATPSPTVRTRATHAPLVAVRHTPAPPAPAPVPSAPVGTSSGGGQIALINQDRAAAGLPPLQWNACLANVAIGQAQRMAAQGYISHANGRTLDLACHLGYRASESIGVQMTISDAAMNTWFMNDPIHRDNIMGPYHWVAAAWVVGRNGAYLAVEFG